MPKSLFELTKDDVEIYMADKGINNCPLCLTEDTLIPVFDDDLKVIFKETAFLKYSEKTNIIEPEMNSFEVMITCSHCGHLTSIAPGSIASHLSLDI